MTISDTGCEISAEIRDVFDPFFTVAREAA